MVAADPQKGAVQIDKKPGLADMGLGFIGFRVQGLGLRASGFRV